MPASIGAPCSVHHVQHERGKLSVRVSRTVIDIWDCLYRIQTLQGARLSDLLAAKKMLRSMYAFGNILRVSTAGSVQRM